MLLDNKILQRLHDNDTTLTSLNFKDNRIGNEGAKAIASMLERNATLTTLYLGDNSIGDECAKAIASMLEHNATLTTLDLYNNRIGNEGAKAVASMLECNATLTTLDLYYNRIGAEGAKAIASTLESNTTITKLGLRSNHIRDDAVFKQVRNQIDSIIRRNQQYIKELQVTTCQQLMIGRFLLYKTNSNESKDSWLPLLPLEIREMIVTYTSEKSYLANEQQRLILNYAEGKIAPVTDKLSFFKVTKCDRIKNQLKKDEVEAASCSHNYMF